jgi:hypothetical protein
VLQCGPKGTACQICADANQCTTDTCDGTSHQCKNVPLGAGTTCDDNKYCTVNDQCDATHVCQGSARDCATPLGEVDDCKVGCDEMQHCHMLLLARADGVSCTRYATPTGGGQCQNGTCCTGCRAGLTCPAGDTLLVCGANGIACKNCLAGYDLSCVNVAASTCVGGQCNVATRQNGTACGILTKCCNGVCQAAACP